MFRAPNRYELARQGYVLLIFIVFLLVVFLTSSPYKPSDDYAAAQLQQALDFVQAIGPDTQIFLYPDGQPTTKIYASTTFKREIADSLVHERPGRYRQAWGREDIAIVAVDNFFTADQEAREAQLRDLPLPQFIKEDMLALPQSDLGCHAANFQNFGWAGGGYVLVDLGYHREHSRSAIDCVLAGFDAVDGLPLKSNSFDQTLLPDHGVRLVLVDYVRLCSHNGLSDAEEKRRSRSGITTLPSLGCVAQELAAAIREVSSPSAK